jgi:hypothetical protein
VASSCVDVYIGTLPYLYLYNQCFIAYPAAPEEHAADAAAIGLVRVSNPYAAARRWADRGWMW